MVPLQPIFQQCSSAFTPSLAISRPPFLVLVSKPAVICCRSSQSETAVFNGNVDGRVVQRNENRLGLPSKGRMAEDTLDLLKLTNIEVWFQRPKDIVRKLLSGDLDLGIVGLDAVSEYGQLGPKFVRENGLKHVTFSTVDGALEAAPVMGIADAILDLVSSGTTLHENNMKEIEGRVVLESQAVLVASRKSLIQQKGTLDTIHEILERLEAHLRAVGQLVTANMRGSSAEEVAERVLNQPSLSGLQDPSNLSAQEASLQVCTAVESYWRKWGPNFTFDQHF
ncbi:hypothetical protein SLA2020_408600 [Shorea laevis]